MSFVSISFNLMNSNKRGRNNFTCSTIWNAVRLEIFDRNYCGSVKKVYVLMFRGKAGIKNADRGKKGLDHFIWIWSIKPRPFWHYHARLISDTFAFLTVSSFHSLMYENKHSTIFICHQICLLTASDSVCSFMSRYVWD